MHRIAPMHQCTSPNPSPSPSLDPNPTPNPNPSRKADTNLTFGPRAAPAMTITASGSGLATAPQPRVDHESLANCHVLPTAGQLIPKDGMHSLKIAERCGAYCPNPIAP